MKAHLISFCKNLYLDRDPLIAQIKPNLIRVNLLNGSGILDNIYFTEDDEGEEKMEAEPKSLLYI